MPAGLKAPTVPRGGGRNCRNARWEELYGPGGSHNRGGGRSNNSQQQSGGGRRDHQQQRGSGASCSNSQQQPQVGAGAPRGASALPRVVFQPIKDGSLPTPGMAHGAMMGAVVALLTVACNLRRSLTLVCSIPRNGFWECP